jgi:hypothetical protein
MKKVLLLSFFIALLLATFPALPTSAGCLEFSLPAIGANYTRDTLKLSGDGIIVGILEQGTPTPTRITGGILSMLPDFVGSDITRLRTPPANSAADNHASLVAAIMVGNRGVVPNARIAP